MKNEFKEIYINHTGKFSDKWMFYINEWDQIFSPYKDSRISLLEIGIQNGGSLEVWGKYFTNASHFVGCDIDEACRDLEFDDPRISVVIGDANTDEVEESITKIVPEFDIIIDDGSHISEDIIRSFSRYFTKLNVNGIYVIEDLHASYWKKLGGGIYEPYSAMMFLKRLADLTNYEHWHNNLSREEYLQSFSRKYDVQFDDAELAMINSIKFSNSLCVIQKKSLEDNLLGKRVIIGSEEKVTENTRRWHGTTIHDIVPVKIEDDLSLDVFTLIERNEKLGEEVQIYQQEISSLTNQIDVLEKTINDYETSLSWRITKPLRKFMQLFQSKD